MIEHLPNIPPVKDSGCGLVVQCKDFAERASVGYFKNSVAQLSVDLEKLKENASWASK